MPSITDIMPTLQSLMICGHTASAPYIRRPPIQLLVLQIVLYSENKESAARETSADWLTHR
jgi:hypothetical protein